ncbi:TetR/AcrR family transcriptional regulator [Bacillaceae bacterium SIJ1]|uniref:TetR/AcrR family transcriptional regulator n=1 Tax=Litoribacterium kuwaitense TaxID=1398745 RepID=UPI0013EBD7A0|nr:TetR/AcrR family transcriptional regulator [Litoribacterium kuwaitense]NGP45277.1 TetR/AcrR family transcriptional regulator [Litoribacterium kuwaitense]
MTKKEQLLEAASRVIVQQGLDQLTLDAVALEAGVSKGGLLYHFPSKDALIEGMNRKALSFMNQTIHEEIEKLADDDPYRFTKAFAEATLVSLEDPKELNMNLALLAAAANQNTLISLWQQQYAEWQQFLIEESRQTHLALTLRFACDGLWFSYMFALAPPDADEARQVIEGILHMMEVEA